MKPNKSFASVLNRRFAAKQDQIQRQPGVMGDGAGNLYPPGLEGFVYVIVAGRALPVFNNRVVAQYGTKVWVGYAPEEPTLFQVLGSRSESPAGTNVAGLGYAPAKRYEWLAPGGGQDPLNVHLRAFTPLKLGMSALGGMYVNLFRGFVYSGTAYLAVARQDLDLTAHIPATSGKAALVLITIDNTGAVVQTKGSEVDLTALALSDLPAIPANTVFVSGAVRVYNGQTAVREGRANTDFVDLRLFASASLPEETALNFVDLEDVPASYTGEGGKLVAVKATEDGLEFLEELLLDFTNLQDVPASYTGEGGKLVAVKATEDGLEFVAQVPVGQYRQFVWVKDGSGGWEFVTADGEPVLNLEDLE